MARKAYPTVIPAKAGIHFDLAARAKMDPGFRRDDGMGFQLNPPKS
jgi:hypothetical protein